MFFFPYLFVQSYVSYGKSIYEHNGFHLVENKFGDFSVAVIGSIIYYLRIFIGLVTYLGKIIVRRILLGIKQRNHTIRLLLWVQKSIEYFLLH